MDDMPRQFGENFRRAAEATTATFGNNAVIIPEPATAVVGASFFRAVNGLNLDGWNSFTGPSNLDLSRYANSRFALLLAWDPNFSPSNLDRFKAKRIHRNTLFRLVLPVKS